MDAGIEENKPTMRSTTSFGAGFGEFAGALRFTDYWLLMGWKDVRRNYSRMRLGLLWVPMSQALFVGMLGYLYAIILEYPLEVYVPYLAAGIVTWNLIRWLIMDAGKCYTTNGPLLLNSAVSPYVLVLRMIWRNYLIFFINLSIPLAVTIGLAIPWSWHILLAIPGLVIIFLNAIWIGIVLAHYCARYRDLKQMIGMIMQPMFFITPIIWTKDKLGGKAVLFSYWNPFYSAIEMVRAPLQMKVPELFCYQYMAVITIGGWMLALWMLRAPGRRVVFWL
jgi:ABC-2 type transport system permease protein